MNEVSEAWTPNRMIYYPDGHRRWVESKLDQSASQEEVEEVRYLAYQKGAETCVRVIQEFADVGGDGVDVFLTRPSTYAAGVQGRTSPSLISIHNVIRTDLVKVLSDASVGHNASRRVKLDAYTRADLPRYALPPTLTAQNEVESWSELMDSVRLCDQQPDDNAFSVNLLINYDGHIENEVVDRLLLGGDLNRMRTLELQSRLLPKNPSYDIWLRTAPETEAGVSFRMSCGPTRPLAETSMVMIPKLSPDVTSEDIREVIQKVITFRCDKKHLVQPVIEGQF